MIIGLIDVKFINNDVQVFKVKFIKNSKLLKGSTTVNKSGLIWHILYTHFCVKITCWLIISKLCCGLSASVYIKPEWEKNTLEFSGAKFPLSFSIMVVLNGKIYIIVLAACDIRKIQVSCPKLKKIRITILILQA